MYNVMAVSPVKERVLFLSTLILPNVGRNRLYNIISKDGFGVKTQIECTARAIVSQKFFDKKRFVHCLVLLVCLNCVVQTVGDANLVAHSFISSCI